MSKYSQEELKEMAQIVMNSRGSQQYIELTEILCFFTQLPLEEVVKRIEGMANA